MLRNNRINCCFRYHLRGLTRATLLYMLVFLAVDILLPTAVYFFIGQRLSTNSNFQITVGSGQVGSTTFWLSTMIFVFVCACASFREEFNHLLAMSSTRRSQFLSLLPLMLIASVFYMISGLAIRFLEIIMESLINQSDLSGNLADYGHLFAADHLTTSGGEMLLVMASFLGAYAFGLLAGILFYRYGRIVMIPFWICFGSSIVILPILATGSRLFQKFLSWFLGLDQTVPSLTVSLHLVLTAVILLVLSGLFIRKVPQNA